MNNKVCPIEAIKTNPACYYCMTNEMSRYYQNNAYNTAPMGYFADYRWREMMESQMDQEAYLQEQESGPFIKYPLLEETIEEGAMNQVPEINKPMNQMPEMNKYNQMPMMEKNMNQMPEMNKSKNQMQMPEKNMASPKTSFTREEALEIGRRLGVDFNMVAFDQFLMGLQVELEHGIRNPQTDVTGNNPILTGKIALAHINEIPDYYTRLKRMEEEAKAYYAKKGIKLNL